MVGIVLKRGGLEGGCKEEKGIKAPCNKRSFLGAVPEGRGIWGVSSIGIGQQFRKDT